MACKQPVAEIIAGNHLNLNTFLYPHEQNASVFAFFFLVSTQEYLKYLMFSTDVTRWEIKSF